MSLKARAQAVLQRNQPRNQSATDTPKGTQLYPHFNPLKVARVACNTEAWKRIVAACYRLEITPDQFLMITTEEDRELIKAGVFSPECLRAYAMSLANGISTGRIQFHPVTQALLSHN